MTRSTAVASAGGDLCNISNPYLGWKYDFGPSSFDRRNIFFANFVYQIPLLKNSDNKLLKTTLGGWEVAGIITAQSGAPLNIGLNGQNVASIVPNTANRPDLTGHWNNPHTVNQWFDTSVYSSAGSWGMGQHTPQLRPRAGPRQLEPLPLQELRIQRSTRQQPAVPRGVLQHLEPHPIPG